MRDHRFDPASLIVASLVSCGIAVLLLASVALADSTATGGTTTTVTCDSTTTPVPLVTRLDNGVWVANDRASAVWIWVAEVDSAALMTARAGVPIAPGNAVLFSPNDGWHGALFCLADTTGSATVRVNRR